MKNFSEMNNEGTIGRLVTIECRYKVMLYMAEFALFLTLQQVYMCSLFSLFFPESSQHRS